MSKPLFIKLLLVVIVLLVWVYYLLPTLKVATGYAAKYTCSYLFLSNIHKENIDRALNFFPVKWVKRTIDNEKKQVKASFFGFIAKQTATYYQKGVYCGCILNGERPEILNDIKETEFEIEQDNQLWPQGNERPEILPFVFDREKLNQILSETLEENPGIYAIVVAKQNTLVAEKYQKGVDKNSRILGWSITKTIGNALFGILEKNKLISIDDTPGIKAWEKDSRQAITLKDLLQMNSGLRWSESYTRLSNVTQMLYLKKNFPDDAIGSRLESQPGKKWVYASGTSNILSKVLRSKIETPEGYLAFPRDSLFNKLNMSSALIELDNAGNHVLSSYAWATASDWTKFGLLYLNKGNWFGNQLFSKTWVDFSTSAAAGSEGKYGAQIWLNQSGEFPSVPRDAFFENGFGGQRILIIPSMDVVITVLSGREKDFDFNTFYAEILSLF